MLARQSFLSYAQSLRKKGALVGLWVLLGWFEKSITDWIQTGIQTGNSSLLQGGHSLYPCFDLETEVFVRK